MKIICILNNSIFSFSIESLVGARMNIIKQKIQCLGSTAIHSYPIGSIWKLSFANKEW